LHPAPAQAASLGDSRSETANDVLNNAQWLAEHLKALGYDYCHLDDT